jgi:hypothetical protein
MSFTVLPGASQWMTFTLKTTAWVGGCNITQESTSNGPGAIVGNRFGQSSGPFRFTGQFDSPTTSSGTYQYVSFFIFGCGYLNQTGTWTASRPAN